MSAIWVDAYNITIPINLKFIEINYTTVDYVLYHIHVYSVNILIYSND